MNPLTEHMDIKPLLINVAEEPSRLYTDHYELEEEPWYLNIKAYLQIGDLPQGIKGKEYKLIRTIERGYFLNREVL